MVWKSDFLEYPLPWYLPPNKRSLVRAWLGSIETSTGEAIWADVFVFACGPWLPKLFRGVAGNRTFPTRQEGVLLRHAGWGPLVPASGNAGLARLQHRPGSLRIPDLEGRGFK